MANPIKSVIGSPLDRYFAAKLIAGLIFIFSACGLLLAIFAQLGVYKPSQGLLSKVSSTGALVIYFVWAVFSLSVFLVVERKRKRNEAEGRSSLP